MNNNSNYLENESLYCSPGFSNWNSFSLPCEACWGEFKSDPIWWLIFRGCGLIRMGNEEPGIQPYALGVVIATILSYFMAMWGKNFRPLNLFLSINLLLKASSIELQHCKLFSLF